jgi:hypothetical protein
MRGISDCGLRIGDWGFRIGDWGLGIADFRFQILDFGFWILAVIVIGSGLSRYNEEDYTAMKQSRPEYRRCIM